jgi:hypothetical protein
MRRLSLILLISLLVLPAAALAARKSSGDGVFELRDANGVFVLSGRGVFWGQVGKGYIRVTDTGSSTAAQPLVSGYDRPPVHPADDPTTTIYWGTDLHFRANGGKYWVRFRGTGVNLTAIGVGVADIEGAAVTFDMGQFAVDGGKWTDVPRIESLVAYGTTPSSNSGH